MRDILFRGRSTTTGEWVTSMTVSNGTIKRKYSNTYMESANNKWLQVERKTIGQYTGLKDKTGKQIFEGDIVKLGIIIDNEGYEVSYLSEEMRFYFHGNGCRINCHTLRSNHIEIIGNIHDNPELLGDDYKPLK